MDERRRLQSVFGPFAGHVRGCETAEFLVHQRRHGFERALVARLPSVFTTAGGAQSVTRVRIEYRSVRGQL